MARRARRAEDGGVAVVHPEFREHALATRVAEGVLGHDSVRAHGAVVAALQLYPIDHAIANIFLPALLTLEKRSGANARQAGSTVIQAHVRRLVHGHDV
jgi:hypothetical protein